MPIPRGRARTEVQKASRRPRARPRVRRPGLQRISRTDPGSLSIPACCTPWTHGHHRLRSALFRASSPIPQPVARRQLLRVAFGRRGPVTLYRPRADSQLATVACTPESTRHSHSGQHAVKRVLARHRPRPSRLQHSGRSTQPARCSACGSPCSLHGGAIASSEHSERGMTGRSRGGLLMNSDAAHVGQATLSSSLAERLLCAHRVLWVACGVGYDSSGSAHARLFREAWAGCRQ